MHNSTGNFTKPRGGVAAILFVAVGLVRMLTAHADEAQAKATFKTMSDYIAAQKSISFDIDTNLEVVTTQKQKVALASSGTVTLNRPNKIHVTRNGGFADTELVFDGKTLTASNKDLRQYAQVAEPGTIEDLIDVLRDKYNRPAPAADLLTSDVYGRLMPQVVTIEDLGSGVIRGIECDHFAFRMKETDVQIWVAHGARPYPCRYVITSTDVEGWPQYSIDVSNWKTGTEVATDSFSVKAPADFKRVKPEDLHNTDELPDIFRPKEVARSSR